VVALRVFANDEVLFSFPQRVCVLVESRRFLNMIMHAVDRSFPFECDQTPTVYRDSSLDIEAEPELSELRALMRSGS